MDPSVAVEDPCLRNLVDKITPWTTAIAKQKVCIATALAPHILALTKRGNMINLVYIKD